MDKAPLLEIKDLAISFGSGESQTQVTRGIEFSLQAGETLGIVGESGSGKSITALALMGLLPPQAKVHAQSLRFMGGDMLAYTRRQWRNLRGPGIAMVFQDPMTCLNPLMTCGEQVAEALRLHRAMNGKQAKVAALSLFEEMGLPEAERRYKRFPHELSGGQRQRVMIAMALACRPKLLIADEPTTALDVTVQAQILALLRGGQKKEGMGLILITHDLGLVRECVESVIVMYAGRMVERGPVSEVLQKPFHPYTRGLLASIPDPDHPRQRLTAIPGTVPSPRDFVPGCRFHPRCPMAEPECRKGDEPPLQPILQWGAHQAACPVSLRQLSAAPLLDPKPVF